MGKLTVGLTRCLLLCAVLLVLPTMMLSGTAFAQSSTVSINPTQGPVGTRVTGTGANWLAGDRMQISWDSGAAILANTTVRSDGTFSADFTVPSTATEGAHTIYFTDLDSRYFLTPTFTVTHASALADLIPTEIRYNSADLVPGRKVTFHSGVQNAGSQGTGVFNVRWFVDGVSVGYGSHQGVPANTTILNGNSAFAWVATAGTHTITFAVDVDNQVKESNKSNNTQWVTVTVASSTPTLAVQKVWTGDSKNNTKTSFAPGEGIHYLVQVKNPFTGTVTATFTFVATGPGQSRIFSWSGARQVAPGTRAFYSPATIPLDALEGTYTLTVIVEYKGMRSSRKSTFTVTPENLSFKFPWDASINKGAGLAYTGGPHVWIAPTRSGLDFSTGSKATHILAMAGGVVTFVGQENCKGGLKCNTVKVHHDNGYDIWYVHLSSFAPGIAPNVRVSQGTWLGNEGNSGVPPPSAIHIHIELRLHTDSNPLNGPPVAWAGKKLEGWQLHQGCLGYDATKNTDQKMAPCDPNDYGGYINKGALQAVPDLPYFYLPSTNRER